MSPSKLPENRSKGAKADRPRTDKPEPDKTVNKRHRINFKRPHVPRPPGFRHLPFRRPSIKEVVRETTSGGVVFRRNSSGATEVLLIQDAKKRWTIPKGHVEPGEHAGATAEREIREETGLQEMEVYSEIGKVDFRYRRVDTLVLMTMHIWLVEAKGDTAKLDPEDWLSGIRWFPAMEAIDKIAYEDIGKIILLGLRKIRKGNY